MGHLLEARQLVLDPELGTGFFEEQLDAVHRRQSLVGVDVERGDASLQPIELEDEQVARENDRTLFSRSTKSTWCPGV